jgi:hypothetical protein
MSTGTTIVDDALMAGGISSSVVPADTEQQAVGFRRLMSMLNLWLSWGIQLNFTPIDAIGQDLDEPEDATNAIVDMLAIDLLKFFRMPVPKELMASAKVNFFMIKSLYQEISVSDATPSSTLPRGQGNAKGIDARVFQSGSGDQLGN